MEEVRGITSGESSFFAHHKALLFKGGFGWIVYINAENPLKKQQKKTAQKAVWRFLSGKRDSSPRKRGQFSRDLYLHPQPLEGVHGVASGESSFSAHHKALLFKGWFGWIVYINAENPLKKRQKKDSPKRLSVVS